MSDSARERQQRRDLLESYGMHFDAQGNYVYPPDQPTINTWFAEDQAADAPVDLRQELRQARAEINSLRTEIARLRVSTNKPPASAPSQQPKSAFAGMADAL